MTPDLLTGLNAHLTLEFRASHEYLAMSIWLAEHDLPGFSKWMRQQSSDELMHAQRIIDHLVERDQKVQLPSVDAPPMEWNNAEALCAHVLKNGQASGALFAAASTNGDATYVANVSLAAGDWLDFLVGVASDNCYGDTTPVGIRVVRR